MYKCSHIQKLTNDTYLSLISRYMQELCNAMLRSATHLTTYNKTTVSSNMQDVACCWKLLHKKSATSQTTADSANMSRQMCLATCDCICRAWSCGTLCCWKSMQHFLACTKCLHCTACIALHITGKGS